jgi:hypothetical protein
MLNLRVVEDSDNPNEVALSCPNCGSDYLHQIRCDAFWREENSEHGVHSISSLLGSESHSRQTLNPSARRDGILVRFECENCSADPELAIVQNKGHTNIYWNSWRKPVSGQSAKVVALPGA